jgi:hypothetical protein
MNAQTQAVETEVMAPAMQQNVLPMPQKREQFSLAPRTLTEAMEFAKMMADSEMVPKNFRGKPGDVIIAVQMGAEVGLSPMAAIQNIAVINGKPGIYGDAGKGILLAAGCIVEEDDIEIVKATGRARCKVTRRGRPPVERTYTIDNARTAGLWNKEGPWRTNPERQMAWRAFWFAARDAAADLLKGLGGAEELADYGVPAERDITPQAQRIEAPKALPPYPDDSLDRNLPAWRQAIADGKKTADQIIAMVSSKGTLTDEQKAKIRAPMGATPSAAPAVTFEVLADRLRGAPNHDMLDADATLVGEIADPAQRAELTAIYNQRKADLEE